MIRNNLNRLFNTLPMSSLPLSVTIKVGLGKYWSRLSNNAEATKVADLPGSATQIGYLEKQQTILRMYLFPFMVSG